MADAAEILGLVITLVIGIYAWIKRSALGRAIAQWSQKIGRLTGLWGEDYGRLIEFAKEFLGDYERVMDDVKRGVKIAIVDDILADFPIEYLKEIGFRVKSFESITMAQIEELREFDVVFLDIADILEDDPVDGGVKVMEKLANPDRTPRPVVIAVSGQQFDIERVQFFKGAHDVVKKPIGKERCESVLLDAIDPFKAARHLDDMINKAALLPKHRSNVMWCLIEYMRDQRSWESVERELKKHHQWPDLDKSKNCADSVKRWKK